MRVKTISLLSFMLYTGLSYAGDADNDFYTNLQHQAKNLEKYQDYDPNHNPYAEIEGKLNSMQGDMKDIKEQMDDTKKAMQTEKEDDDQ